MGVRHNSNGMGGVSSIIQLVLKGEVQHNSIGTGGGGPA